MLGTEMAEMRPRDASPSPGERRRMSLGCERNAKSRKVDAIKVAKETNEGFVAALSPMILMSGLGQLRLSDQNNNNAMVSGSYGDEPKTPPPTMMVAQEMQLFGEMKRRIVSVGSDDDDEREIEIVENEKRRNEVLSNCLVHFIRSPTDGVFLPFFKKKYHVEQIDEICEAKHVGEKIDETKCGESYDNGDEAEKFLNDTNNNSTYSNCNNKKLSIKCSQSRSGLPLSSSPAPMRKSGSAFTFDKSLRNPRSIKNALSMNLMSSNDMDEPQINSNCNNKHNEKHQQRQKYSLDLSKLNLPTPNCLLGNFEESLLNGRMNPVGTVDGFYAEIGASGSFLPDHVKLPVFAAFYHICDDIAASPYLGVIDMTSIGRRGYKVPNKGTIQVTLFNPNNTVVKMFVVMYDLSDMPPNHRTFLRQRTMYVPMADDADASSSFSSPLNANLTQLKSFLRYSIHLRFSTSKTGKLHLHTNIKLIFPRNKCEIDPRLAKYEYKTFTEAPKNPRYSSKR